MKTIINEATKGLLFKKGRFVQCLDAGTYHTFGSTALESLPLDCVVRSSSCPTEVLLKNPDFAKRVSVLTLSNDQLALHFIDGSFKGYVTLAGKHAFWNDIGEHSFIIADLSKPEIDESIPMNIVRLYPDYCQVITIENGTAGLLYFDNEYKKMLEPGTYYFWKTPVSIKVVRYETRTVTNNMNGQELLTKDKITIRVNFTFSYVILDGPKLCNETDNYADRIYTLAQLALRECIGSGTLDDILDNKEAVALQILNNLKQRAELLFVEIKDAGIRDLILPGEIRDIMNTVLVAEKKAQANVIARREEVASTRSLLNTARLMEENKTLYRLKELESIERICENVGNITLGGDDAITSQIGRLLGK